MEFISLIRIRELIFVTFLVFHSFNSSSVKKRLYNSSLVLQKWQLLYQQVFFDTFIKIFFSICKKVRQKFIHMFSIVLKNKWIWSADTKDRADDYNFIYKNYENCESSMASSVRVSVHLCSYPHSYIKK